MVENYDACGDHGKWKEYCVCEDSNASCDNCGSSYRVDGEIWCQNCINDDTCENCKERSDGCYCGDDRCGKCSSDECPYYKEADNCINCGLDPNKCGCCGEKDECYECLNELSTEFDEEFICDTFRPMNAFNRARWLKAQGKL